jgi:hypothetical protein
MRQGAIRESTVRFTVPPARSLMPWTLALATPLSWAKMLPFHGRAKTLEDIPTAQIVDQGCVQDAGSEGPAGWGHPAPV